MVSILEEKIKVCSICTKRSFNPQTGLVCSLTAAKPAWENSCTDFLIDSTEAEKKIAQKKAIEAEEQVSGGAGIFNLESKGVLGGAAMMVIAFVWFFGALAVNRIFFYPPVLFIVGLVVFIKGLMNQNVSGKE